MVEVEDPGQSQSPVGDTSPMVSRGPICLMRTQLLASWQQWAQDQLRVIPDPWSRHTLSCSLRTEDDSGLNPACKSTHTNPHFVYFPKAYFVIGLNYVLVYMMIQRHFL